MDEESVGLFGILLIVTALVMSHSLHKSQAMPVLPALHWEDVVSVFGCGQDANSTCYLTASR